MAIKRMNHAVLYVRDADRTTEFYRDVLGFRVVGEFPGTAKFLQAPDSTNDHDLALFTIGPNAGDSTAGRATVGLYHIAWEVQTLGDLQEIALKLQEAGALVGATDHSTTKALYAKDPDGLEFEVCWLVPAQFLNDEVVAAKTRAAAAQHPGRHRALRAGDRRRRLSRRGRPGRARPPLRPDLHVREDVRVTRPACRASCARRSTPGRDELVRDRDLVVVADEAPAGEEGLPRVERRGADQVVRPGLRLRPWTRPGTSRSGGWSSTRVSCQIANISPCRVHADRPGRTGRLERPRRAVRRSPQDRVRPRGPEVVGGLQRDVGARAGRDRSRSGRRARAGPRGVVRQRERDREPTSPLPGR